MNMDGKKPIKYSIPIYENGVLTDFTIDFQEGDEKWHEFMHLYGEIPLLVNVKMKKHG